MLRIIKIVTSKTYVQNALILNGFFLLAQPPGEREHTIVVGSIDKYHITVFNSKYCGIAKYLLDLQN